MSENAPSRLHIKLIPSKDKQKQHKRDPKNDDTNSNEEVSIELDRSYKICWAFCRIIWWQCNDPKNHSLSDPSQVKTKHLHT